MSNLIKYYDANRLRKTYPLIRLKPRRKSLSDSGGVASDDIETAIVSFINESSKVYVFTNQYESIPVIGLTPEDENVNVYLTSLTTNSFTIEASASFVGKVHVQVMRDIWFNMSRLVDKGKSSMQQGSYVLQINFSVEFSNSPVVKITSDSSTNIFLTVVTNNYCVVNRSNADDLINIHYIAIESES